MSLSDRRAFLISGLALGALSGCGYSPALGTGGAATPLYGQVRADDPEDENSFRFANRLEARLGAAQSPRFRLSYDISTKRQGLAITGAQETTRYNLEGKATYVLREHGTGAVLLQGEVNNFTGYSTTGSTVSTRFARLDAAERLMIILADQLVTELIGQSGKLAL